MTTANNLALYNTFLQQCHVLNVNQRLIVNQYIDSNAPTQPVESSSVNISLDYCLVKVRRPWYVDVFINQKSWYIPAVPKGQVKFPLMPSGFVVIRNLKIGGDWTNADIKNASNATHFGPFQVTLNPETHQLVHPGLQIIGWILQRMPDLPPNQDPKIDAAYEEAAKVLSNKANQLLSNGLRAVIQQFPGVMPSGSDQRRLAVCLRDLNYYLKPVIDSCGAGSTNPIDNALAGIKETNQSLGFSVGWSVAFYQYIKANHGLSGDAAAVANKYLDYAIGQLS
jgi:phycocyanin alpha chain